MTGRRQEAPDHKKTACCGFDSELYSWLTCWVTTRDPDVFRRFDLRLCVYFQPVRRVRQTETDEMLVSWKCRADVWLINYISDVSYFTDEHFKSQMLMFLDWKSEISRVCCQISLTGLWTRQMVHDVSLTFSPHVSLLHDVLIHNLYYLSADHLVRGDAWNMSCFVQSAFQISNIFSSQRDINKM